MNADVPVQIAEALKRAHRARLRAPCTEHRAPCKPCTRMAVHPCGSQKKRGLSGVGVAVFRHVACLLRPVAAQVADKEPVIIPARGDRGRTRRACDTVGFTRHFSNRCASGSWSGESFCR